VKGAQTLGVFAAKKKRGEKIVMITAYDVPSALIAREGGADAVIVGDSVANVMLGYETTLPVTLEEMLHHCAAVARARPEIPIVADLPYGTFHVSPREAARAAVRMLKEGGATAVKIEGGRKRRAVIEALLDAEAPVMGHLGLTPQSVHRFGGYKVQGRGAEAAERMADEAAFLQEAGCFALVLECVPAPLASRITRALEIPTIGIGAGPGCDGQVLVFHDLLGFSSSLRPSFVKRYAELGDLAVAAVRRYAEEVRSGAFPGPEHSFDVPAEGGAAVRPDGEAPVRPPYGGRRRKG
jgi:3-methyl-2-oxobutanoate hydroxymethyltransferase